MATSFHIRPVQPRDLVAVNALMHASSAYQGEYYKIIEGYYLSESDLDTHKIFLAEDADAVLGFYSLVVVHDFADLNLMFVSDAAQGRGVGAALFDHMKQTAQQCGRKTVMIGSHPPSVGFYERMGAVRCGVAPPVARATWERPLLKLEIEDN